MNSKLTLSIDEQIILKAKSYARKNKRSLSALIENYLRLMVKEKDMPLDENLEIMKLKGSLRLPDGFDYKAQIANAMEEKYSR